MAILSFGAAMLFGLTGTIIYFQLAQKPELESDLNPNY
jgi:hypothetical protein